MALRSQHYDWCLITRCKLFIQTCSDSTILGVIKSSNSSTLLWSWHLGWERHLWWRRVKMNKRHINWWVGITLHWYFEFNTTYCVKMPTRMAIEWSIATICKSLSLSPKLWLSHREMIYKQTDCMTTMGPLLVSQLEPKNEFQLPKW